MIASIVLIEEKTGQQRSVTLQGAALPLQGTSWKTTQALVTKWYSGNPWEATQHVMGPWDPPSELRGIWNTTRLVSAPALYSPGNGAASQRVTVASDLRDIFDGDTGIIRSGALLQVTWATDDGRSIARQGRIGESDFNHVRFDDINWTMNFVWTGRGTAPSREAAFKGDDALTAQRGAVGALNDLASTVPGTLGPQTAVAGVPQSATATSIGNLESVDPGLLAAVNAAAATAGALSLQVQASFTSSMTLSTSTAFDVSATASASATAAAGFAADLVQQLGQVPAELMAQPGSSAAQMAATAAWVASISVQAQLAEAKATDLAVAAAKQQNALQAQTRNRMGAGAVRATVKARRGDTFASLALRYLGSADLAGQLARANGMPSFQIAPCPGAVVAIPVMTAADLTSP